MTQVTDRTPWAPGCAPVAVIMLSLNEGHNMRGVLENLSGWAQEIFLVDSYSQDDTVDIALQYGVHVVQREFRGFGDQWNFAIEHLPIRAPWTMKLDPDERLSRALKGSIATAILAGHADGILMRRTLYFMGRRLPVSLVQLRAWRTGVCRFSVVAVNEHPVVDGTRTIVAGELEHHDSPDLDHWVEKQNRYTTAEAAIAVERTPLADHARLFGTSFQRRMWLKKHVRRIPFRYTLLFLYHWLWLGACRAGWVGYAWAHLRVEVSRLIDYKCREMEMTGTRRTSRRYGPGAPDLRVLQQ